MNYREKIRKAIECPQLTGTAYGEWGALRLDQRKLIKRLLDELDRADNYVLRLYNENDRLKDTLAKIKDLNTMQYLDDKNFKYSLNEILIIHDEKEGEENVK